MYNSHASSQVTGMNNPFSTDPSNPRNRFPDLSTSSPSPPMSNPQYTSWMPQQQQQQQQPQQFYQQSSFTGASPQNQFSPGGYGTNMNTGGWSNGGGGPGMGVGGSLMSQPTGFQPSSSFGQQLTSQLHGSSYGYLNGQQQQQQQQSTYNPAQQQLSSPSYIAQLDPYSSIGQGWDGSQQSSQMQMQSPTTGMQSPTGTGSGFQGQGQGTTSRSANGEFHPREYIRTHKSEIESWDSYAWKQLLNAFDALKDAWEARKKELEGKASQMQMQVQYSGGGYYAAQLQQEATRLQGLSKEADSNFDSVAASSFQMQEVFQNYRQSGDRSSKSRVREATNAALQSLPDWPQQSF
ncbi:hypothetical protein PQX77_010449 [Marasmius sp. AFHP31]|nr:hypothetical protein PQX77_010449 [Marasmius sp. AFHP31]